MLKYFPCLVISFAFLISCHQKEDHLVHNIYGPKVAEAHGLVISKDSMFESKTIFIDESKLKIIPVGKPNVMFPYNNIFTAGTPTVVKAGNTPVFIPGQGSYLLPKTFNVINSTLNAGIPEVVIAKDPIVKDHNSDNFTTYRKQEGLIGGKINCIIQDKRSNLWIGTNRGVSMYNGKSFTLFTKKEGISGNFVKSILEDKSGNLWFGTNSGISKYDGKSFTHYFEDSKNKNYNISSIIQDKSGNLWFGTLDRGVIKYDGKYFTHITKQQGLCSDTIYSMIEAKNGDIWFGTCGGASKYNPFFSTFFTERDGFSHNTVYSILQDKNGNLWFGTNDGVFKYDGNFLINFSKKEGLSDNSVLCMLQDKKGNLWFGTDYGVSKYDGISFTHFSENEGLGNNKVLSMLQDKNGNFWFGTSAGVSKYNENSFSNFTFNEVLNNNNVSCILQDKSGNLWFGTYGNGVSKYDGKSFTHFTKNEGLSNNQVKCILQDKNGNLWFGTTFGVSKFDGTSFTHYLEEEGINNNFFSCILQDKKGNIWFGTNFDGVFVYDGKSFTHFTDKEGFSDNTITSMFEDKIGNIWFGTTFDGVLVYNGESFTHFTEKEGLINNTVISILQDKIGNMWLGTLGYGVSMYDGKSFTTFAEKEGLSNNFVRSILQDKNGNLWFGTDWGLSKMTQENLVALTKKIKNNNLSESDVFFKNYSSEDGFLGTTCNCLFEASNGTIWMGSNDRLTAYYSEGEISDTISPKIQLTSLQLFNENIPWISLKEKKDSILTLDNGIKISQFQFDSILRWYDLPQHLSLDYTNNYITFNFIGVTMDQPLKVKYQYKLDGNDNIWSAITPLDEASYGNLSPGQYIFKVKAMNSEGYWSTEFQYPFTIRPPWWASWLAYFFYALVGGSIVYSLYRYRINQLEIKQATKIKTILSTQAEERKRIAIDLHDTIGSTLSSISIYSAAAEHMKVDQFSEVLSTIKLIGQNTRAVMENMSDIIWAINPANDTFQIMMERLQIFSIQILDAKDIQLRFDVPEEMQSIKLSLPQRKNIYLILREAIHNVAKYSKASLCVISAKIENKTINLSVIDDGTGFDNVAPSLGGNGLINMRQRADELKAFFQIHSEKEKGTRVFLQFAYS